MPSVGARGGVGARLGSATRCDAANEERRGGCNTSVAMARGLEKASTAAMVVRFDSAEKKKEKGGGSVRARPREGGRWRGEGRLGGTAWR
jgi:hypothetical protein